MPEPLVLRAKWSGAARLGDRVFEAVFTAVCVVALVGMLLTIGWFAYEVVAAVVHAA